MVGYRSNPNAAHRIRANVEGRAIPAHELSNALGDALQAIKGAGDTDTDLVIYGVGGLEADLHDAPARIDARVARASHALGQVLGAIENGDRKTADETPTVQSLLGTGGDQNALRP